MNWPTFKLAALICGLAVVCSATTTVSQANIQIPGGAKATGYLTIAANAAFQAADGVRVETSVKTVRLVNGGFSIPLEPNDCTGCAGTNYNVVWHLDGAKARPETWLIPTTTAMLHVTDVVTGTPALPSLLVQLQQLAQDGASVGEEIVWNGSSYGPGNTSYSIDLIQPGVSDSGLLQKTQDLVSYTIVAVSCSVDVGSVQVNLDVRSAAFPNAQGTSVLAIPLTCTGAGSALTAVTPAVTVPAGSPVALDILAVSGNPGIVRVHVSK